MIYLQLPNFSRFLEILCGAPPTSSELQILAAVRSRFVKFAD